MKAFVLIAVLAACTGEPATPDAGVPNDVPVACDGHLCATTNGGGCQVGGDAGAIVAVALLAVRRRRR